MFTGTLLHVQSLQVIVAWCKPELAMLLEVLSMIVHMNSHYTATNSCAYNCVKCYPIGQYNCVHMWILRFSLKYNGWNMSTDLLCTQWAKAQLRIFASSITLKNVFIYPSCSYACTCSYFIMGEYMHATPLSVGYSFLFKAGGKRSCGLVYTD